LRSGQEQRGRLPERYIPKVNGGSAQASLRPALNLMTKRVFVPHTSASYIMIDSIADGETKITYIMGAVLSSFNPCSIMGNADLNGVSHDFKHLFCGTTLLSCRNKTHYHMHRRAFTVFTRPVGPNKISL
jgi:hypothetical protein